MMWLRALTLMVALLVAAGTASAEEGTPFEVRCEPDSYLTGFEGRAGDWIDQIKIICAHWNEVRARLGAPVTNEDEIVGSSRGGNPMRRECPAGWIVANTHTIEWARWGDDEIPVLHSIGFTCRAPGDSAHFQSETFGSGSSIERRPDEEERVAEASSCFPGEVATGIEGRHGLFIFGFKLICASSPNPAVASSRGIEIPRPPPSTASTRRGGKIIVGEEPAPNTPPPPPITRARVTSDTDVFRKTSDGRFVRLGSAGDFLPKGFVAPVIVQQQGWWQLELKTLAFVPGGAGWVAADHLELVP